MALTIGDLISETSAQLHGWGSSQDRLTPLSTSMSSTDTTFTVDFAFGQAVGITPGVVEIGSEQLYVVSVDATTGICTVAGGFGRGYSTTTAAAHPAGTAVISRPKFPRVWLLKQMNNVLNQLYPSVYATGIFTGTVTYPSNTYTLPGVATGVIDAQWQDTIGNWRRCYAYMVDPLDRKFRLGSGPMIGRPLRVIYEMVPTPIVAETDLFSATGLPASCADLLTLGVVARVVPGLDISRAQASSVEQSDRSRVVPPSAGVNVAKYVMAEFQDRLRNEAATLRKQYPPKIVRTW